MARFTIDDRKYPNSRPPDVFPFDLTDGEGKVIPYRDIEFYDTETGEVVAALHDPDTGKVLYKKDVFSRPEKAETVVGTFYHTPPLAAVAVGSADANGESSPVTVGIP